MHQGNNGSQYEPPRQDGPPGRGSENRQLQWILESMGKLHSTQQELISKIDKIEVKVEMKQKGCAESLVKDRELMVERHTRLEERIASNHSILEARIENAFERSTKAVSELRSEIIKWVIGLALAVIVPVAIAVLRYAMSSHP
ncbi:hypothetical protein ACSRAF_14175 [Salmonella enterica]|uniref:hypothetical protein n=1 Tax=Salmonella enterica TaxID=28901 RepID=UPI003EDBDB9A